MDRACAFALFETPLGDCAVAWRGDRVRGVWLPEDHATKLRARVARRLPEAFETEPPAHIASAIVDMQALMRGAPVDLGHVALDVDSIEPFDRHVYVAARTVPPGRAVTYGELASRVGPDATPRGVGESLGRNPFPIVVPCHRIVAAHGALGGFSAPGGSVTKRKLLAIENARLDGPADLFGA